MKKLFTVFMILGVAASFAGDLNRINLKAGDVTTIAFGEKILTVGCEIQSTSDQVINLISGSTISVANGEEVISVSCE